MRVSVTSAVLLFLKRPWGNQTCAREKQRRCSHVLPRLRRCLSFAHSAKLAFHVCVALHLKSAPLLRNAVLKVFSCHGWRGGKEGEGGEKSRRHPAAVLMRFFLGFDGVPVALPLL